MGDSYESRRKDPAERRGFDASDISEPTVIQQVTRTFTPLQTLGSCKLVEVQTSLRLGSS